MTNAQLQQTRDHFFLLFLSRNCVDDFFQFGESEIILTYEVVIFPYFSLPREERNSWRSCWITVYIFKTWMTGTLTRGTAGIRVNVTQGNPFRDLHQVDRISVLAPRPSHYRIGDARLVNTRELVRIFLISPLFFRAAYDKLWKAYQLCRFFEQKTIDLRRFYHGAQIMSFFCL